MARKPAAAWLRRFRAGIAVGAWVGAALVAECAFGVQIGWPVHRMEQRIERELKSKRSPPEPTPQAPRRSHDDAGFESWELVDV